MEWLSFSDAEGIAEGIRLGLRMVIEKPLITGIDPIRHLVNVLAERDIRGPAVHRCGTELPLLQVRHRTLQRIQNGFLGNLVTITAFRLGWRWTRRNGQGGE